MMYENREQAGRLLAARLQQHVGKDVVVIALPRGGLPVAREVANALQAPLDILVAKKIGAPGNPEFAIGAVTARGNRVLNDEALIVLGVGPHYIMDKTREMSLAATRREAMLRANRPAERLAGRTVIVVDDGVATGMTMRAALLDLREQKAGRVIVAVPVIAPDTLRALRRLADEVVAMAAPEPFHAIGQFYLDFAQVSDEEARAILVGAARVAAKGSNHQLRS